MKRSHENTFLQLQYYCAKNNLPPPTVDKKDIGKRMRIQITVDGQTVSVKSKLGQNITEILNTASQNWFETHVHKVHEVSKDSTLSTVDSSRDSVQIEVEKSKYTKATVTPTVRQVFGMVFGNQMEEEVDNDESEGNEDVVEVDSEAGSDSEDEVVIVKELPAPSKKVREVLKRTTTISDNSNQDVKFIGAGHKEGRRTYYRSAILNGDLTVTIGDTVLLQPHDPSIPLYVARVAKIFVGPHGPRVHVQWFGRGVDTVLGEAADPSELFLLTGCEDQPLLSIWKKCTVRFVTQPHQATWQQAGGKESSKGTPVEDDGVNFWCRFHWTPGWARFTYPAPWPECPVEEVGHFTFCGVCRQKELDANTWNPEIQEMRGGDIQSVMWGGAPLEVGDCIYLAPGSVKMASKKKRVKTVTTTKKDVDEDLYPEYYRKKAYVKGNNDTADPFQIAMIMKIFNDLKLQVHVFYRPEDTQRGATAAESAYHNELYWTEETRTVSFEAVEGRCYVKYFDRTVSDEYIESWSELGPDRWFFRACYYPLMGQFDIVDESISKQYGYNLPPKYPPVTQKLRCLDAFSGCGGLSHGLQESGVAESKWAVEIFQPAAEAYKLNNPECTVFGDDCNLLLKRAMEGTTHNEEGQRIPAQGEVDLMCGGPPCQGFSQMNRFTGREYSQFKNSLVATYLSLCDFYRPKFFILENVRNFATFKKGLVLKLCLATLLKLGYQTTFAILQAGQFGVPQARRRLFILAAAPGETLPLFPEPQHVISPRTGSLVIRLGGEKYHSNAWWTKSAPFRQSTVRDAIGDLPLIREGESQMQYMGEARSHLQKKLRMNSQLLFDHVTRSVDPLSSMRISMIPAVPGGCDWRDLPNKAVTLKDGTTIGRLRYEFEDVKNGRGSTGAKRGVCGCMEGGKCDPADKQDKTLIPWHLVHTSSGHGNWPGVYGRLEWDGLFSTATTNPEPQQRVGRVIHPDQNSVREWARAQGFPDTYKFHGSTPQKYRQIGNAVPPPLARAIGLQIREAMAETRQEDE